MRIKLLLFWMIFIYSTITLSQDSLKIKSIDEYRTFLPWLVSKGSEIENIFFSEILQDSIKIEGEYELVTEALLCLNCFVLKKDTLIRKDVSTCVDKRVGEWTEVDMKTGVFSKGRFSEFVHESFTTHRTLNPVHISGPYSNGSSTEYLKDGVWETYTKDGRLFLESWYKNGVLVHETQVH